MKIIGNESIYFEIDNSQYINNLVPIRINIKGNYLGTLESTTYLPSFIGSLEDILESDYNINEMAKRNNIRSILFDEYGELVDKYRITFEDTFDDFSKRVVRNSDLIFFYFKLHENFYFNYPEIEEKKEVLEYVFKKDYIEALEGLKKYISYLSI